MNKKNLGLIALFILLIAAVVTRRQIWRAGGWPTASTR